MKTAGISPSVVAAVLDRSPVSEWRVCGVLASRPGVSTVLALESDRGPLVAKIAQPDRLCREIEVQAAVGRSLSGEAMLAVPPVLFHDVDAGVAVMRRVQAPTVAERLSGGDLEALSRTGQALACLHALRVDLGRPTDLARHLSDLVRPAPEQWRAHSPLSDRAALLLEAILEREPAAAPMRIVHRDVHLRQLLDDGRRVWLLDWEHAATGDPALDLGNLYAYLQARRPAAVARLAISEIAAGYEPWDSAKALSRVPIFEAFTFLRLACKSARSAGAGADAEVDRLLGLAARRLSEVEEKWRERSG